VEGSKEAPLRERITYSEGRLREHLEYYGDGSPAFKTLYSDYDTEGNWRKKTMWNSKTIDGVRNFEPFMVTYRFFSYY
jgi:hypothetical protein